MHISLAQQFRMHLLINKTSLNSEALFSEPTVKMLLLRLFLTTFIVSTCFATFAFGVAVLPNDEVEALREIARSLEKKDWNFSADPCSGVESGWVTHNSEVQGFVNNVSCNCTFLNNTVCHVVSIALKAQSLPGTLPPELVKLPYLQNLDLTRNYLNGTIPPKWGSTKLVNISLLGNRLTGSIPKELGNITTLASLTVEFNQLSGVLPPELGDLPNIERLLLSSNNFTGELPPRFARLSTLKDFRIADTYFKGQIPNFIQYWTNLENLVIQGSGLDGPIPSGISSLEKLQDLRISDLNGTEATFPQLNNSKNLHTLVLRSCNIIGQLPEYLGKMANLKTLDLSFNKLSGEIPNSFESLPVEFMYLTGNKLTGSIPNWILQKDFPIDLSYNSFTSGNSESSSCPHQNLNLFSSLESDNSGIVSCLRSFHCPQTWYSLRINCGGKELIDGKTKYEEDTYVAGASSFVQSKTNWAFSSSGGAMDGYLSDTHIGTNITSLAINTSQLYMDARLSPLSLTYYGFCLGNGNYTINLHFAEIMFTDNKTFYSLGRRMFDVYIQGTLVLKDFNIEDEAGGVGKEIIKNLTAVVTSTTLEIRFYWAGKGTTAIPYKDVYGPLISAISVDHDFILPSENGSSISVGTIAGIVAAVAFVILLILGILLWKGCLQHRDRVKDDLKGLDLQAGSFTLRQIKAATNNFDAANKIGEGGFGSVYKGLLSDGTIIAVKQLSPKSKQGNREFVNEIGMISALQHPHLVKLYGCCVEGNQLLLVYEYMEKNSLARALFGPEECGLRLDWPTRHKICVGIARGLAYLHEESRLKIVHRDIKATNVLLDKNLNAKISDFGLAKLDDEENTHISTGRIAGTYGYMAPEYAMHGYLTDKADVYSFGIVALEIVSGRNNTSFKTKEDVFHLLDWALILKEKGSLMELVDPTLGSDFNKEQVMVMINVALLCTNESPGVRPTMSSVVSMLEGKTYVQELVSGPSITDGEMKLEEIKNQHQHIQEHNMTESQTQSNSTDVPWTASSTSAPDLYPNNLDSDYWEKTE